VLLVAGKIAAVALTLL